MAKLAIKLIYDYLKERKQRTKVNNSYSSWSILGPILFNIFINDIHLKKTKISNYADDNTTYTSGKNVESLLKTLKDETSTMITWF